MKKLVANLLIWFSLLLFAITFWFSRNFGDVSFEQIWSTAQFSLRGTLAATDPTYFKSFFIWALGLPSVLALGLILLNLPTTFKYGLILGAIFFTMVEFKIPNFLYQTFIATHLKSYDYFGAEYQDPRKINYIRWAPPKNLVLIYVESLETTYSDLSLFPTDFLTALNKFKPRATYFTNYWPIMGATWTVGALVSTQCGLPLKVFTIFNRNLQGQMLEVFLPNAICLGNILAKFGYHNVFMNGSSLDYGGIRRFLTSHGYQEAYGREEWLAQSLPTANLALSGWGMYDDELFVRAKQKLTALMHTHQPFNLTILTIDTHGISGCLNHTCRQRGVHNFLGIIECTSQLVADFLQFIQDQRWARDISVIVIGDHLAMRNDVSETLVQAKKRTIFNLILSPLHLIKLTDNIVAFDWLPTMLETIGIHPVTGRLGLGYSALVPPAELAHITQVSHLQHIADLRAHLESYSPTYAALWLSASSLSSSKNGGEGTVRCMR